MNEVIFLYNKKILVVYARPMNALQRDNFIQNIIFEIEIPVVSGKILYVYINFTRKL